MFLSLNSNDIKQIHFGEYQSFYKAYSEEPQLVQAAVDLFKEKVAVGG